MIFNTQVRPEDLQKHSLFIATPMYGGQCTAGYAKALSNLTLLCAQHGIKYQTYFIVNESLIQRARNYCAELFLNSGATHMLFIDADIEFKAQDVINLLGLQVVNKDKFDVMAAPYPKKGLDWGKVKYYADKVQNPNDLAYVTGDYVFNLKPGAGTTFRTDEPVEVMEAGTGFMLIPRYAFERFARRFPKYSYRPDHVNMKGFDGQKEITAFFHCEIDKKSKRYLSEDYFFCHKIREIGMKVHLVPWIELTHIGNYHFNGSIIQEAQLNKLLETKPQ